MKVMSYDEDFLVKHNLILIGSAVEIKEESTLYCLSKQLQDRFFDWIISRSNN